MEMPLCVGFHLFYSELGKDREKQKVDKEIRERWWWKVKKESNMRKVKNWAEKLKNIQAKISNIPQKKKKKNLNLVRNLSNWNSLNTRPFPHSQLSASCHGGASPSPAIGTTYQAAPEARALSSRFTSKSSTLFQKLSCFIFYLISAGSWCSPFFPLVSLKNQVSCWLMLAALA